MCTQYVSIFLQNNPTYNIIHNSILLTCKNGDSKLYIKHSLNNGHIINFKIRVYWLIETVTQ